jgi:hypothetical protein
MTTNKKIKPITSLHFLHIGGIDWDIIDLQKDIDDCAGKCSTPVRHTLQINKKQFLDPKQDYIDTILHEIIHAICSMYLLSKSDLTEMQVSKIAEGLEQLFLQNPDFGRWLVEYTDWQRKELKKK